MKKFLLLLISIVALAIIGACAGATPETVIETVIETVVVKEEVEVIKEVEGETVTVIETVEVIKEVEVEKEVVVTVEVQSEAAIAEAERRKTVIFDIDGGRVADPELFNPYVPGRRLDQGVHQAVMEPLFMLNYETGEIEPWLGTEMTSNDAFDVWTLKLRDGIKWSDGEDFNADDVVFTINMLLDNAPELNWSAGLENWIENVEKVDDSTVTINLKKSNPRFQLDNFSVRIWGGPTIVPEHIWQDQDPLTFKNFDLDQGWPIFTGPYTVDNVNETEFTYVRNDDWWGAEAGWKDLPEPEKLIWVWYGPEETRVAAMVNGGLDSMMDVTLGALLAAQQRNPEIVAHFGEMPFAWVPDPCSRTFEVNHTVAPWDNKDMRWALNYAIDRDEIVAIAYEGSTFKSRHFFPAYPPLDRFVDLAEDAGLYETYPMLEHNPDKAKDLIEANGYVLNEDSGYYEKDGQELTIDIATHEAFIEKQRIAAVIVEEFQRIGINATTRNEAGGTWGDNFELGTFEARVGWQTCGSVNEPWASLDTFNTGWLTPVGERTAGNQNAWRWSGEKADAYSAIIDEMGVLPLGDPQLDDLFVEAMEIWLEELPAIPVTQAEKIIPFSNTYWTGWPTADNAYIHPPTWWQHTHAIIHNLEAVAP
jgi:peptide/nickel transport system substrate-binding protein